MSMTVTPVQRAERLAARQEGVVDSAQASSCGLSSSQLRTLVRSGRWVRVTVGVYRVAGAPETARQHAMVAFRAARRAGGIVSHASAAADWNLMSPPAKPWITVPSSASARSTVAIVHRSDVPPVDRAHRDGLELTSVSRTIVDLAGVAERSTVEAVVDAALSRRLATASSVEAAIERVSGGRRGKALARDVIAVWTPGIEPGSPAEVRLMRAAASEGIEGLVAQFDVYDDHDQFVARLDLAQPELRRGFEYDGVEAHNPRRWSRDEARYARLAAIGWQVETVTKLDLLPGERRLRDIAARWRRPAA